jgi:hypothetical protein
VEKALIALVAVSEDGATRYTAAEWGTTIDQRRSLPLNAFIPHISAWSRFVWGEKKTKKHLWFNGDGAFDRAVRLSDLLIEQKRSEGCETHVVQFHIGEEKLFPLSPTGEPVDDGWEVFPYVDPGPHQQSSQMTPAEARAEELRLNGIPTS